MDMTEVDREREIAWIIRSLNAIFKHLGRSKDAAPFKDVPSLIQRHGRQADVREILRSPSRAPFLMAIERLGERLVELGGVDLLRDVDGKITHQSYDRMFHMDTLWRSLRVPADKTSRTLKLRSPLSSRKVVAPNRPNAATR
jgi:hypothetical protein